MQRAWSRPWHSESASLTARRAVWAECMALYLCWLAARRSFSLKLWKKHIFGQEGKEEDRSVVSHIYIWSKDLDSFFLLFLADPLRISANGRGNSVNSHLHVSSETLEEVKGQALAGSLKDIRRLILNPLLWLCVSCCCAVVVQIGERPYHYLPYTSVSALGWEIVHQHKISSSLSENYNDAQ